MTALQGHIRQGTLRAGGRVRLAPDEVVVWSVGLDVPRERFTTYFATLARDERERIARLRFERDRRRFVVARGALRALLGRYLGAEPARLRFAYNAFGKPELRPEFGSRLRFNLSHAGDRALIAVAADADVGVDVEEMRALPDYVEIARHYFSPADADRLSRQPGGLGAEIFFACWTRREAYLKARGEGWGSIHLPAGPEDEAPARRWSLFTLHPAPGYMGAVAVAGSGWRVTQRHWS